MGASAIALQGLEQADTQLNDAAEAIVTAGAAPSSGGPSIAGPNIADLGADIISLTSAQTLFEANLATIETADQMEQSLIDVTA